MLAKNPVGKCRFVWIYDGYIRMSQRSEFLQWHLGFLQDFYTWIDKVLETPGRGDSQILTFCVSANLGAMSIAGPARMERPGMTIWWWYLHTQSDISLLSDSILFYLFLFNVIELCVHLDPRIQATHPYWGLLNLSSAISPGSFLSFFCFCIQISCSWCGNDPADGFPKKHSSPRAGSRWHVCKGSSPSERAKAGLSIAEPLDSHSRPICFSPTLRRRKRTEK